MTECKGSSSGLVDDSLDVNVSNLSCVLGSLSLRVIEVSWHSDHSLLDVLTQVGLGGLPHLGEDERSHLRGRVLLALSLHPGVSIVGLNDFVR